MPKFTTSVGILLGFALIFFIDAALAYFQIPTISQTFTDFVHFSSFDSFLFGLGIGIFVGHIFFSIDYRNK